MAQLTRLQLVTEGMLLGQRQDIAAQAAAWLQRWLDSVAASWPWPLLHQEAIGVPVAAGVQSISVGGAGSVGETRKVLRIIDNMYWYTAAQPSPIPLPLVQQQSSPQDHITVPGNTGTPTRARLFNPVFGTWTIGLSPYPNQAILLSIPYIVLPAALASDSDVPWYPNDETMVQAIAFKTFEYFQGKDDDQTQAAQQLLASSIANDRIRYGSVDSINSLTRLNPSRFKRARQYG
jgi:hypothetical protein